MPNLRRGDIVSSHVRSQNMKRITSIAADSLDDMWEHHGICSTVKW